MCKIIQHELTLNAKQAEHLRIILAQCNGQVLRNGEKFSDHHIIRLGHELEMVVVNRKVPPGQITTIIRDKCHTPNV